MAVDPRVTFAASPRPADGGPGGGRAGAAQIRLGPDAYPDGSSIADHGLPNPRAVSNAVFKQTTATGALVDRPSPDGTSALFWVWGQFLDHDVVRTLNAASAGAAPISVPAGDPVFAPGTILGFNRSTPIEGTGTGPANPREYANAASAYLDGSMIYGSDAETRAAVREPGSAKLRLTRDGTIDFASGDPTLRNGPVAGDARANENVALLSMHALFAREHNRLVDALRAADPGLSTAELFEGARARVEAIVQAITFQEYLPRLIGAPLPEYSGFKSGVSAAMSLEFSTAVYRLGHSMLSPTIARQTESGATHPAGDLALRDAFNVRGVVEATGIEAIFRGMAGTRAQALDTFIVEDVRSLLFGAGGPGSDLAALNIQRGRDHGMPSYNEMRAALGLAPKTSFAEIAGGDGALAARLRAAYGDVSKLDLWVGGLAEPVVRGGMVGETFRAVLVDQFTRMRDGDRFWSEGRGFSPRELDALWSTTLSDVIRRNSDVAVLQAEAFAAMWRAVGDAGDDDLVGGPGPSLIAGLGGDDTLRGGTADDEIYGGAGDDVIRGNAGDDLIYGGGGADRLVGGPGSDVLYGGRGRDVFVVVGTNAITDAIYGGRGRDTLEIDAQFGDAHLADTRLIRSVERFNGRGEELLGTSGDDRLDFTVFDVVSGLAAVRAGRGDDLVRGAAGDDRLYGGGGDDRLFGGDGHDRLVGGGGADRLYGGPGRDTLIGGPGADLLDGGAGADVLRGGGGDDVFRFRARDASGRDRIEDFDRRGDDRILLVGYDFGVARPGRLSEAQKFAAVEEASSVGRVGTTIDLAALGGKGSILVEGERALDFGPEDFLFG